MAALAGGGAAYYDAGSVIQTDEHGVVVDTVPIPVGAAYWHGIWSNGQAAYFSATMSGSSEAFPDSNGTSQIKKPFVVTIAPWNSVNGNPGGGAEPYTFSAFFDEYTATNRGPTYFRTSTHATTDVLYSSLSNAMMAFPGSPGWGADVVGIIAHSAYDETVQPDGSRIDAARGLEFWNSFVVRLQFPNETNWVPKPGTDLLPAAAARLTQVWYQGIGYSPKVVFIATCYAGPLFDSLWAEPGPGQIMILPKNSLVSTDLY